MTATLTPPSHLAHVLDLRAVPPREHHVLIFGHFNALATGQALQLVNDHDPQPLRGQFDERSFGQYEWTVLQGGPQVWRIQVARIADAASPRAEARGGCCCSGGHCCG